MNITPFKKKLTGAFLLAVVVSCFGRLYVSHPAIASTQVGLSSRAYQELRAIGAGLAQGIRSPGVRLVVFSARVPQADTLPHPLLSYLPSNSVLPQLLLPIEIQDTLYGTASSDTGVLVQAPSRYRSLRSFMDGRSSSSAVSRLALGNVGPATVRDFSQHIGVLIPAASESIWHAGAREEFSRLQLSGVLKSLPAYQSFQGWTMFPIATSGQTIDQLDPTSLAELPLPPDLINDLRAIVQTCLPLSAAAISIADFFKALSTDRLRNLRKDLKTDAGKVILDELELAFSERIMAVGLTAGQKYTASGPFTLVQVQPSETDLQALLDNDTATGWGLSNQGAPYELTLQLASLSRISRIDINWGLNGRHAPVEVLLSHDGGLTYEPVGTSSLNELCADNSSLLLDGETANYVKIRYNQSPIKDQMVWSEIAEIDIRSR